MLIGMDLSEPHTGGSRWTFDHHTRVFYRKSMEKNQKVYCHVHGIHFCTSPHAMSNNVPGDEVG